jgi:Kef-type K+ transport system membrane component KefB
VPFFFVITGSQVNWRLFVDAGITGLALGVTTLALLGKLLGCGLGMLGQGRRSVAIVGVGMAPRGEVGLIVASLALSLGAIPPEIFSVVVIMSILSSLVVPPLLRALYAGHPQTAISKGDAASQAGLLPEL